MSGNNGKGATRFPAPDAAEAPRLHLYRFWYLHGGSFGSGIMDVITG